MNHHIDTLYKTIAAECAALRPEHWIECTLVHQNIERYSCTEMHYSVSPTENKYYELGTELLMALRKLRDEMAILNNNQAWYTATFRMTPDGKYHFEFDYDHLPALDIMPSPDKWRDEFKRYPRPALQAQIQDWLDGSVGCDQGAAMVQRLSDLQRQG